MAINKVALFKTAVRFYRPTPADLTRYLACSESYTKKNKLLGRPGKKYAASVSFVLDTSVLAPYLGKLLSVRIKMQRTCSIQAFDDVVHKLFLLTGSAYYRVSPLAQLYAKLSIVKTHKQQHKITAVSLSKNKQGGVCKGIEFTGLQTNRLISELERLFGQQVLINVRTVKKPAREPVHFVFRKNFCKVFAYMVNDSQFTISEVYDFFAIFGKSHDLKFLVEMLVILLDETPYPNMQRMISNIKKMIRFFWYFWAHWYKAAGMYLTLSGKLSWHLLTISRTVHLRLGKTAASMIDLNALYEYKEYTSDTGAYGLTIRFYSRSIILKRK